MGNSSSMLTQYDIEEVQDHCNHAFSQQEIVSLYHRFCQLDRNAGGFIAADEFLSVPEFAVNPLAHRLLRMLDGLNFKDFVAFLSPFSAATTLHHKIEFIFKVYDSDCNGKVAFNDVLSVLRDLTGAFMSEQQRQGMGNSSSMLTQYDIEEVQDHCNHAFSQQDIMSLYHCFCHLDRNGCCFITADEFLSVPEFTVNPHTLDGLNFRDFVAFLSPFSAATTLHHKIEFIFKVYDLDCNGKVAFNDVLSVLRDLTGAFMSEQQRQKVLTHVLEEAGYTEDSSLSLSDFLKILGSSDLKMEVEVPID